MVSEPSLSELRIVYGEENSKFKVWVAGAKRIFIILQGWPMVFYGLRLKYALEGDANYITWKDRMEVVLEENGLMDFIDQEIPKPVSTNAQDLV